MMTTNPTTITAMVAEDIFVDDGDEVGEVQ